MPVATLSESEKTEYQLTLTRLARYAYWVGSGAQGLRLSLDAARTERSFTRDLPNAEWESLVADVLSRVQRANAVQAQLDAALEGTDVVPPPRPFGYAANLRSAGSVRGGPKTCPEEGQLFYWVRLSEPLSSPRGLFALVQAHLCPSTYSYRNPDTQYVQLMDLGDATFVDLVPAIPEHGVPENSATQYVPGGYGHLVPRTPDVDYLVGLYQLKHAEARELRANLNVLKEALRAFQPLPPLAGKEPA